MLIQLTDIQAEAVLGALRNIATARRDGSPVTVADRRALEDVRAACSVRPLDPAYAADDLVPTWYHPVS